MDLFLQRLDQFRLHLIELFEETLLFLLDCKLGGDVVGERWGTGVEGRDVRDGLDTPLGHGREGVGLSTLLLLGLLL